MNNDHLHWMVGQGLVTAPPITTGSFPTTIIQQVFLNNTLLVCINWNQIY